MTSDHEYVRRAKLDLYGPNMIDGNYWTARHGMELVTRLLAALEREEKLREALEELVAFLETNTEQGAPDYAHAALSEPRGNFEDTQDTNPEGGC